MGQIFWKYEGAGNDFVILRDEEPTPEQVRALCDRHRGVGADGVMSLLPSSQADFRMVYFNADGSPAAMCGNGARCIARFAFDEGFGRELRFMGSDGEHRATVFDDGTVRVGMRDVSAVSRVGDGFVLNTGVPHYVEFVSSVDDVDVAARGRTLRFDQRFGADGVNVNFASVEQDALRVRTYERGVEAETLACGTGATAAALATVESGKLNCSRQRTITDCAPTVARRAGEASCAGGKVERGVVEVRTKGGDLSVSFRREGDGFVEITLTGPARRVFKGEL